MKKLVRPISRAIRNIFRTIRDLLSKKTRFIRLNPLAKGRIAFFDKKNKQFFFLSSRGEGDSSVLDTIFSKNCYSLEGMLRSKDIYAQYSSILALGKNPLIIDCGSNIGAATYFFANEFPEAKVIGIELESNNAKLASKNNSSNPNVHILHAAIGPESGSVVIDNPEEVSKDSFRTKAYSGNGKGSIDMISIPDIQKLYPDTIPFIVKIDIEGFEDELFSRNTQWMKVFYLITLEIHDWMLPRKAISKNFFREHSKESRDCYLKGDMVFSIKN
jgi:FkbM family methyltransferase